MKRVTIKDLAKAANLSITTVSRALNGYDDVSEKTRMRVKALAAEMNYAPDANARSLGGKTSKTIAMIVSELQPTDDSGFTFSIISGIYNACLVYDLDFIFLATSTVKQEELSYIQLCRQKNVDGVVVLGLTSDDPYYREVLNSEIPCVLIDISVETSKVVHVSVDNEKAAFDAVNYLIDNNHREIAILKGKANAFVSNDRYNGYLRALEANNIELNKNYTRYGEFDTDIAYQETTEMLKHNEKITAVFCASDLMAIGCIRAINDLGMKVPEDISVMGFDGIVAARYAYGGITTVKQNPFHMGNLAGVAVSQMLEGNDVDKWYKSDYELIEGNTVKKLKN